MATEKQLEALFKGRRLPRTEAQLEHARNLGKRPRSEKERQFFREIGRKMGSANKGKPHPHKGNICASDIVKHHNDLCHGAQNPNDVSFMSHSEHSRLHANLRVKNGTHNFQN